MLITESHAPHSAINMPGNVPRMRRLSSGTECQPTEILSVAQRCGRDELSSRWPEQKLLTGQFMALKRAFCVSVILAAVLLCACRNGNARNGAILFQKRGCSSCHTIAASHLKQGPDLHDVSKRFSRGELQSWLRDPDAYYRIIGRRPMNRGFSPMPRIILSDPEIADLTAYLLRLNVHDSSL
jgi:hypothetical protein